MGRGAIWGKLVAVFAYPLLPALFAGCTFGLQPATDEGLAALGGDSAAPADADADTDSDTDSDTDTDTDADADAPAIDSIDPTSGATAGGTVVTLYGTFEDDVTVRVGGADAEVTDVHPRKGTLTFVTPASAAAGTVNVVIESGGQTAKLVDGFTYVEDGTGKVGMVGSVTWFDQVGDYWSGGAVDRGSVLLTPTTLGEWDWNQSYSPTLDTCASDQTYSYTTSLSVLDVGASSKATLQGGGNTFTANWNTTYLGYYNNALTSGDISAGRTVSLVNATSSNGAFSDFSVPDLVAIPGAFAVTAPPISGTSPPLVSKSFTLSWGGSGGDGLLVSLGMVNSSGSDYQEVVTCALRDDGSFIVPSSAFTLGWPTDRELDIYVSRYTLSTATLPYNNADAAVIGEYTVFGAAFTK